VLPTGDDVPHDLDLLIIPEGPILIPSGIQDGLDDPFDPFQFSGNTWVRPNQDGSFDFSDP
jgi:hypothetical protein